MMQQLIPHTFVPNFGLPLLARLAKLAAQGGHVAMVLTSERHAQITQGTTYKNIHGIKKKGVKILDPHAHLQPDTNLPQAVTPQVPILNPSKPRPPSTIPESRLFSRLFSRHCLADQILVLAG